MLIINSQRQTRRSHRAGENRAGKLKQSDTGGGGAGSFQPLSLQAHANEAVLLNCIIYVDNSGIIITATQIKLHHN